MSRFAGILPLACLALAWSCRPARAAEPPRAISFRVNSACTCAECSFEANRKLPKLEGVTKTALSVKDRRLDVMFAEGSQPISELAGVVRRLDMGKDSTLLWPVPSGCDVARGAEALAKIPGVVSAKPDPRARAIALTFGGKPAVRIAQLDAALKGTTNAPV